MGVKLDLAVSGTAMATGTMAYSYLVAEGAALGPAGVAAVLLSIGTQIAGDYLITKYQVKGRLVTVIRIKQREFLNSSTDDGYRYGEIISGKVIKHRYLPRVRYGF